jgi:hypothetical protein
MKRILVLCMTAVMTLGEFIPVAATATIAAVVLAPTETQALPVHRRAARQAYRARCRAYYGLPVGAVPFVYGGYRYYRVGGAYYYPYMYGGRTVYVDVGVYGGYPVAPPPIGSIDIYFY